MSPAWTWEQSWACSIRRRLRRRSFRFLQRPVSLSPRFLDAVLIFLVPALLPDKNSLPVFLMPALIIGKTLFSVFFVPALIIGTKVLFVLLAPCLEVGAALLPLLGAQRLPAHWALPVRLQCDPDGRRQVAQGAVSKCRHAWELAARRCRRSSAVARDGVGFTGKGVKFSLLNYRLTGSSGP